MAGLRAVAVILVFVCMILVFGCAGERAPAPQANGGEGVDVIPYSPNDLPGQNQVMDTEPIDFFAPEELPFAVVGTEYRYSFCQPELESASDICGSEYSSNPQFGTSPYHFQLDSGTGFAPMGVVLSPNGLLAGTPSSPGTNSFTVCAVDAAGTQSCKAVKMDVKKRSVEKWEGAFTYLREESSCDGQFGGTGTLKFTALGSFGGTLLGTADSVNYISDDNTSKGTWSVVETVTKPASGISAANGCVLHGGTITLDGLVYAWGEGDKMYLDFNADGWIHPGYSRYPLESATFMWNILSASNDSITAESTPPGFPAGKLTLKRVSVE